MLPNTPVDGLAAAMPAFAVAKIATLGLSITAFFKKCVRVCTTVHFTEQLLIAICSTTSSANRDIAVQQQQQQQQ
jgi:hypothetical protein